LYSGQISGDRMAIDTIRVGFGYTKCATIAVGIEPTDNKDRRISTP
jgi:hypothetical protein